MINFDKLPNAKPNQNASMAKGRYLAQIKEAKMVERSGNTDYLRVIFVTADKSTMSENYFEDNKPFLRYKIARLLRACKIELEGDFDLKTIGKVIVGKKVAIDVEVNDKGYAGLDFSDQKEGIYSRDEVVMDEVAPDEDEDEEVTNVEPIKKNKLDKDVNEAITSNDDEF